LFPTIPLIAIRSPLLTDYINDRFHGNKSDNPPPPNITEAYRKETGTEYNQKNQINDIRHGIPTVDRPVKHIGAIGQREYI
jgi:hypothetical protein